MMFDRITRIAFGVASAFLMLLAFGLIAYAAYEVVRSLLIDRTDIGATLLEAVGYTVIAIAVFDVGKYLLEEEAIRGREMRQAAEARRSLTKFISTIAIAVFLEGLVAVFEAGKEDLRMMIYPTLLLFTGVALIIGLGIYQRLSAMVENEISDPESSKKTPKARTARGTA
ncbi:GNAT family acetyltransferase [Phyllobacterium sp. BT25]|uniref:GNAT family acetyltransferase n=1 Tax=Phyllobacterium pellucidum TaxID=2740464 RepID=A0A849VM00_9HYPH|nr:GNAT family acetyltransferase [Phyllobacterium pellucidum]NTS30892.1 GNAT family acetyltransferase [Phyllobacterium pellucidum]